MAKVRMKILESGVDDLFDSSATRRMVREGAVELAEGAAELAPDGGPGKGVRETYRATQADVEPDRIVATAYTTDPFGHLVEFGSINNPAYAPLRRAALRLGLRTRLAPKGQQ